MNAMPKTATIVSVRRPAGLTLMEVLISCGVLAIGLAGVAALLPAAGSRFAQATQADRAGFLAASVRAELVNRGLVAADVVVSGTRDPVISGTSTLTPSPTPAAACGEVITALNTISTLLRTGTNSTAPQRRNWHWFFAHSPLVSQRLDTGANGRGLFLDDDLVYATSSTSATPINSIAADGGRAFTTGLRWGATLIPTSGLASPGTPATLSVVVFRKASQAREFVITGSDTSAMLSCTSVLSTGTAAVLQSGTANAVAIDAARRLVLQPCSSVLVLGNPPRWVRVAASWTRPGFVVNSGTVVSGTENPSARRSFVVLDPNPIQSSTTQEIRIVGFDGLLRVDHYPVTLD
jgi:hypothetical protein